jgi:hypothetical protein
MPDSYDEDFDDFDVNKELESHDHHHNQHIKSEEFEEDPII